MSALIIGGTHGLGLQLAREALRRGIEPIITGRDVRDTYIVDGTPVRYIDMTVENEDSVADGIARLRTQPSLAIRQLFFLPALHLRGVFAQQSAQEAEALFRVAVFGLMNVVRHFHRMKGRPYHFIPIGSTSAWRIRKDESVYGCVKACQAKFAYDFHQELRRDLPGSRTLLAQPGGMNTELWTNTATDASQFLDPALVARIIWEEIVDQEQDLRPEEQGIRELHILREADGSARLERGAKPIQ